MGVVAADVDGNGWTDLFVANDLCPNFLFLNRGDGTFEDAGELSQHGWSGTQTQALAQQAREVIRVLDELGGR
jgi:hypothetical protein